MNAQKKKNYEKPRLIGEKIFEAVALACCKSPASNCGTARNKNKCGGVAPRT